MPSCPCCFKNYKKNGVCFDKHLKECQLKTISKNNEISSVSSFEKLRTLCPTCGQSFKQINRHKCSVVKNPLTAFNFEDSFFNETLNLTDVEGETEEDLAAFHIETHDFLLKHINNFSVGVLNINSLANKFHHIAKLLSKQLFDILIINETKLDDQIDISLISDNSYHTLNRNRSRHGGGIVVYINKSLQLLDFSIDENFELVNITIMLNGKVKIAVLACYRSEQFVELDYFANLEREIINLDNSIDHIIVAGDLNNNMLNQINNVSKFCEEFGFHNSIVEPTRYNKSAGLWTLLDVILLSCLNIFLVSKVFNFNHSDHSLAVTILSLKSKPSKSLKIKSRCLSLVKLEQLKLKLSQKDFSCLCSIEYVNLKWAQLKQMIVDLLDEVAPLKEMIARTNNIVPWFDFELVILSKRKSMLYNKAMKTKNPLDWTKFKQTRNEFTSKFRRKKEFFFKSLVVEYGCSSKMLWNKLYPYLNPNKKAKISPIMLNGTCYSDSQDLANLFNKIFKNALSSFDFLDIESCLWFIHTHFLGIMKKFPFRLECQVKLDFKIVCHTKLLEYLQDIDSKSSEGNVGIPSIVFKFCAEELAQPLTHVINSCLHDSTIPNDWKISIISPVYKGKGK